MLWVPTKKQSYVTENNGRIGKQFWLGWSWGRIWPNFWYFGWVVFELRLKFSRILILDWISNRFWVHVSISGPYYKVKESTLVQTQIKNSLWDSRAQFPIWYQYASLFAKSYYRYVHFYSQYKLATINTF